jgi:hypothetical protein
VSSLENVVGCDDDGDEIHWVIIGESMVMVSRLLDLSFEVNNSEIPYFPLYFSSLNIRRLSEREGRRIIILHYGFIHLSEHIKVFVHYEVEYRRRRQFNSVRTNEQRMEIEVWKEVKITQESDRPLLLLPLLL